MSHVATEYFRMKHKVGLFGGSFNPIHNGHIAIGRTMLNALSLDEVWYMVSPENPWKRGADDLAPEEVRYATVKTALMGRGDSWLQTMSSICPDRHTHGTPCSTWSMTTPTTALYS